MPTPTFRRALPDHASLQDAVRSARQGRDAAGSFRILEEQVGPRLLRYFRGYSFPDEDAEDLVQAVLARVWQALPGLHAEESFLPWLFAIARNVRRAAWLGRRQERSWRVEGAEVPEVPDPHSSRMLEDRLEAERLAAMRTAIAALPAQQRECLLLRVRHELSYEEIAATLRVSLHTVRNHIAAAKKSLRRRLRLEVVEEVQR